MSNTKRLNMKQRALETLLKNGT